eukprot:7259602-Karenia_brevis.AAC.1
MRMRLRTRGDNHHVRQHCKHEGYSQSRPATLLRSNGQQPWAGNDHGYGWESYKSLPLLVLAF